MSDAFLTDEEVYRLTKKKRRPARVRELTRLGYKQDEHFILASDGEPLVLRDKLDAKNKPAQRRGHRWDRLAGVKQIRP